MSVIGGVAEARDRSPPASGAAGAFARVEVHETIRPALPAWRELESHAAGTGYQTPGFALPWYEHLAARPHAAPFIVVGYDAADRPALLLPLTIATRGPFRLAVYAGGKHSNLNAPLMRPGLRLSIDDARALLREAARRSKSRIDLFLLRNQPVAWSGERNAFAEINSRPSPSDAYGAAFGGDAEAFLKGIDSSATRKKLKSKAAKLAAIGPLVFERAADHDRARTILSAFIEQKTLRFSQKHVDPGLTGVAMRAFLDALATGYRNDPPALDLYALIVGDRIVATYGGLPHGRAWHGLFNSFNPAPDIARGSPAELLLRHLIRDLGQRGFERFDLGVGESRYKNAICDERIELRDSILPVSSLGHVAAPVEAARLAAKRWVKHTPWAFKFVEQMRAGPF